MAGYARAIILGNLTRDPEVTTFPSGGTVAKFTVAVNKDYKDKSGQKVEKVAFIDVEVWNMGNGKMADIAAQYLKKGKQVLVEGDLEQQTWEDKNGGGKRSKIVVKCTTFQMVGRKDDDGGGGGDDQSQSRPPARQAQPQRRTPPVSSYAPDDEGGSDNPFAGGNDDIPF